MYAVYAMGFLRVSAEGEAMGLDLHEHGISAYPEYVISSTPSPASMITGRDMGKLVTESNVRTASQPAH
jgi:Amt family ammonium transporter